jgi:orotidine-5'-phosphate decarboxylase
LKVEKGEPRVIVALDYSDAKSALALAGRLSPSECKLKVGKELFTSTGPDLVRQLVKMEFSVFLDLKFHDIPTTVAAACRSAAELGVWMLNVHASGGRKMMESAREAIEQSSCKPLLIAVTVLTSMNEMDLRETGVPFSPREQVMRLADLAKQSGIDGVVCSAQEAGQLRKNLGNGFRLVTPGIRPSGANAGDQSRIMTPASAILAGSDYLVVGRPITRAENPLSALQSINQEIERALS